MDLLLWWDWQKLLEPNVITTSLGKLNQLSASSKDTLLASTSATFLLNVARKRCPNVAMTMGSSASDADGSGTSSTRDVRGSQGSDDQIVKNMAKALKESVSSMLVFKTLHGPLNMFSLVF